MEISPRDPRRAESGSRDASSESRDAGSLEKLLALIDQRPVPKPTQVSRSRRPRRARELLPRNSAKRPRKFARRGARESRSE